MSRDEGDACFRGGSKDPRGQGALLAWEGPCFGGPLALGAVSHAFGRVARRRAFGRLGCSRLHAAHVLSLSAGCFAGPSEQPTICCWLHLVSALLARSGCGRLRGCVFFVCLQVRKPHSKEALEVRVTQEAGGCAGARAYRAVGDLCVFVCGRVGFAPGGLYLAHMGVLRRKLQELAKVQLPGLMPRVSFPDDGGLRLTPLRRRAVRCNFLKYRGTPPRNRPGVRRNSRSLSRSLPALVL